MTDILPIHKAKDTEDPQNYRGIALSDCLSKLFCKIIDNRIVNLLKKIGDLKVHSIRNIHNIHVKSK